MQILTRLNKVIAYSEQGYIPVGNSAVCVATQECYNDALIVTVDCVPTDIDSYNYYYINGKFIKEGSNSVIREVNHHSELQFWVGTQEEYAKLTSDEKQGLFAIITNDTTKATLDAAIKALQDTVNGIKIGTVSAGVAETAIKARGLVLAHSVTPGATITQTGLYLVVYGTTGVTPAQRFTAHVYVDNLANSCFGNGDGVMYTASEGTFTATKAGHTILKVYLLTEY